MLLISRDSEHLQVWVWPVTLSLSRLDMIIIFVVAPASARRRRLAKPVGLATKPKTRIGAPSICNGDASGGRKLGQPQFAEDAFHLLICKYEATPCAPGRIATTEVLQWYQYRSPSKAH
jgi:hypothetical protein